MKKVAFTFALLSITMMQAQKWGKNKLKGDGNTVTETRTTTNYDEISTGGAFTVELVAGKEGTLTMTGDKNLLDKIVVEVDNNKLKVQIEKGIWFDQRGEKIKISIPFEEISKINFGGSGDIMTKNTIKTENLEINLSGSGTAKIDTEATKVIAILSGSGNLNLEGKTSDLEARLSGSGEIDSSKTLSQNASALLSGSGNINVHCTKNFDGKISGSGNIVFYGNPENVIKKVSGSGTISKD